ncbi:MAG: EamA family transporter [Candidatus Riflebacteria bacterium HGW-Riflebacteria-1]|jgi:drug/metabolite transporter (DMT)-like permease|nr:MAG: EamA family transporter [Candidatus Riflebacteria bacterium HGW-Riflebacteria-1]
MKNKDWLWLIILSIIWGSAFMFIKIGLRELSPFIMVFGRLAVSALFMLIGCRIIGATMPSDRRIWLSLGLLGVVNTALPFFLVAWAQQHIDTATASILNATSPVFVMILAHFFTDDEKLTLRKLIGVSAGVAGIVVMVLPSLTHGIVLAGMAQAAMLGATFNYAIGGIYARKFKLLHPMVVSSISLLGASLFLAPGLLYFDVPALSALHMQTIFAVAMLAFFCTGVAFIIYYRVIASAGATNALLVTLMIPVSALFFGVFLMGEQLKIYDIIGMLLIFSGLLIIDGRFMQYFSRRSDAAPVQS